MTKTILGLDLGTTSIGWALVKEGDNADIIKIGSRVIPLTTDEITNFDKGKSITTNADRTLKRSMRRNLDRYKLRRENLIQLLKENCIIDENSLLNEHTNDSTFQTYKLRANAANGKIELSEFARVLLMINKKRGYKSSRKAQGEDEGQAIDGMSVAKVLYEQNLTPGQYAYDILKKDKKAIPDFYRSDLNDEFDKIWNYQSKFYPEVLNNANKELFEGKAKNQTSAIFYKELKVETVELVGKMNEKKFQRYALRSKAINEQLLLGELVEVFSDIKGNINNSSGYLGAISDRSKELFFNKVTVGEFLYNQVLENPHTRLKGQVFYRQDYLDEFETIWEQQSKFHTELTPELKKEIRDIVIFYQRRLKSQKGLLSTCEFESFTRDLIIDGKPKTQKYGPKVIPKSSPLFQDFKIWAQLNNVEILDVFGKSKVRDHLELEEMNLLFQELKYTDKLSPTEINRILGFQVKYKYNFEHLEGNRTIAAFIDSFQKILELSGHDDIDLKKMNGLEKIKTITDIFSMLGFDTSILTYSSDLEGENHMNQPLYQLWHLLYSYEGDNSKSGIESLLTILKTKYGFDKEYASILSNTVLQDDYSSLSAKAIQKILPYLKECQKYDKACGIAGYNHSNSQTTAQLDAKVLKEKLTILSKNSLRNPVVEKILNQMINVVNSVIATYGKPDEIRVEMARELKKGAKERENMTKSMNDANRNHVAIRSTLQTEFGIKNVSRNDIIRYKLYEELKDNGYRTLYSNTYISREMLFNGEVDIEHIIPQARLFDDSFSNKTLELRHVNIKKGNATAFDFVSIEYGEEGLKQYEERVNALFNKTDKRTMFKKLMWSEKDIPDNFINRDLNDTQYIAKKAKEILEEIVRTVGTTTGSITNRLREDWQLVDVMKELNTPKYQALGLVEEIENRHGHKISKIKDWTKRNDHRHHAMDAITIAFTKPSYIQYLNNLNAKSDKNEIIYAIQNKETYFDKDNKRRFNPPMPLDIFRAKAKEHLDNTLISFKAKNKVTTKNKNTTTRAGGHSTVISETPRGQLHLETIYGSSYKYETKIEKVNASFDVLKIEKVAKKKYREALLNRLNENEGDAKKAFTGKNSLDKKPIFLDALHTDFVPDTIKLVWKEQQFTIRKCISPELKIDKVVDAKTREILQKRLNDFGGDPKKAFVNLEENPIFLNKEKGIVLKSVTITGVSNAIALHNKKDHFGKEILGTDGNPIPVDFVNTGNNHHVAIYRDEKGNLQEEVVSFMEAVTRKNMGLPIVKNNHENGWEFLFTMKQNEYFIFPNEKTGFNPTEIDLMDVKNYVLISPNLFRVQKISTKNYVFNHHFETEAVSGEILKTKKVLYDIAFKFIQTPSKLEHAIKVRINHIGHIVQVGEY
jgi:CRISPR-associated endonuclease Csn1